jgi:TetR/AcrR family transcriptional regulator, tetracycline repressor protein
MALSRQQIIDTGLEILRSYGLADLSMRRLARDLGVQPGALYWHVKNKQELLGVLAERILAPVAADASAGGAAAGSRRLARDIRAALLSVRDGADVVSLTQALDPQSLAPLRLLEALLSDGGLPPEQARWGARTLMHFILGAVAEEQTRAELAGAGLVPPGFQELQADEAFDFGVDTILRGLCP